MEQRIQNLVNSYGLITIIKHYDVEAMVTLQRLVKDLLTEPIQLTFMGADEQGRATYCVEADYTYDVHVNNDMIAMNILTAVNAVYNAAKLTNYPPTIQAPVIEWLKKVFLVNGEAEEYIILAFKTAVIPEKTDNLLQELMVLVNTGIQSYNLTRTK